MACATCVPQYRNVAVAYCTPGSTPPTGPDCSVSGQGHVKDVPAPGLELRKLLSQMLIHDRYKLHIHNTYTGMHQPICGQAYLPTWLPRTAGARTTRSSKEQPHFIVSVRLYHHSMLSACRASGQGHTQLPSCPDMPPGVAVAAPQHA